MAVATRRGARGRLAATAAGLAVRIVLGFAAGLALGVVVQDPGLVFGVLAGGAESVELARSEPAGERPADAGLPERVPAPESARKETRGALPEALAARSPAPEARPSAPALPAVSAPPPPRDAKASGFSVQVGAFSERASARRLEDHLRKLGFPTYTVDGGGSAGQWRVRVGPVDDRGEAEALARTLKREQSLPTWILQTARD